MALPNLIEDVHVDTDENGVILEFVGDFTETCAVYLMPDSDSPTLKFTIGHREAEKLIKQLDLTFGV